MSKLKMPLIHTKRDSTLEALLRELQREDAMPVSLMRPIGADSKAQIVARANASAVKAWLGSADAHARLATQRVRSSSLEKIHVPIQSQLDPTVCKNLPAYHQKYFRNATVTPCWRSTGHQTEWPQVPRG